MLIIKSESTDAYFNLALEEYLLKNFNEDVFVSAINEPSILVGVNQNTYQEINALYVRQNNIKVIRRLSGGGTVFQDHGNINFSKIHKRDGSKLTDFSKLSNFIIEFVKEKLGVDAEFVGRNDLVIDGKKFSGHARLFMENKILHHGTLLISSNMTSLVDALKFNDEKYQEHELESNEGRVTNVSEYMDEVISTEKVLDLLHNYVRSKSPEAIVYNLTQEDTEKINELVEKKYSVWDWNYGKEEELSKYKSWSFENGNVEVFANIEDDIIQNIKIYGDFFSEKSIVDVENRLMGCKIVREDIIKSLADIDLNNYMFGLSNDIFVKSFFK